MGGPRIRSALILPAVAFLFVANVCAQIGSVDVPQFESIGAGTWTFSGWAADSGAVITKAEVFIDGTDFGAASYGSNRADACSAIGNWPGCPNVGWSFTVNTGLVSNGEHALKVALSAANGDQSNLLSAFVVDNAAQGLQPTTCYKIVNRATGGVLDVTSSSILNGANLQQWQYLDGANQLWEVGITPDGKWVFETLNGSKALTVPFGSSANGTRVQQLQYYGSTYQQWNLVAAGSQSYAFLNVATGKALDLQGGSSANGTAIQIWDYLGGTNQNWLLIPETNPASGIFGAGGIPGNDPPPQIPQADILFPLEQPPPATAYANKAPNGPVCDAPGELLGLSIAHEGLDSYGNIDLSYGYTNSTGYFPKTRLLS